MENVRTDISAKYWGRVMSFFLDIFFANIVRAFFMQTTVFTSGHITIIKRFMDDFKETFGVVKLNYIKEHHIRYFVNNDVFGYCVWGLVVLCFSGMLYNALCYVFLNSSTIGQKVLSLKVVDRKNMQKPNTLKLLLKAVLVPLPFTVVFVLFVFQFLHLIDFHLYAPIQGNLASSIIVKITHISNVYVVMTSAVLFSLFWYGMYFLTDNKLLLSDLLSGTRVVRNSAIINTVKGGKGVVYLGDKLTSGLERFTKYLDDTLLNWLSFLKNKTTGRSGKNQK